MLGPSGAELVDGARRPVLAHGGRGRRRGPLPDARDGPRVRRATAARGRGSVTQARAAQTRWAVDLCRRGARRCFGARPDRGRGPPWPRGGQPRRHPAPRPGRRRRATAVRLLAAGRLWTVTGQPPSHLLDRRARGGLLVEWEPPPELAAGGADALGSWWCTSASCDRRRGRPRVGPGAARHADPPWAARSTRCSSSRRRRRAPDRGGAALAVDVRPIDRPWRCSGPRCWRRTTASETRPATYVDRRRSTRGRRRRHDLAGRDPPHPDAPSSTSTPDEHRDAAEHARIAAPLLERLHADDDAVEHPGQPGPGRARGRRPRPGRAVLLAESGDQAATVGVPERWCCTRSVPSSSGAG